MVHFEFIVQRQAKKSMFCRHRRGITHTFITFSELHGTCPCSQKGHISVWHYSTKTKKVELQKSGNQVSGPQKQAAAGWSGSLLFHTRGSLTSVSENVTDKENTTRFGNISAGSRTPRRALDLSTPIPGRKMKNTDSRKVGLQSNPGHFCLMETGKE